MKRAFCTLPALCVLNAFLLFTEALQVECRRQGLDILYLNIVFSICSLIFTCETADFRYSKKVIIMKCVVKSTQLRLRCK